MQCGRPLPALTARSLDRWDVINQILDDGAAMSVGAGQPDGGRGTVGAKTTWRFVSDFARFVGSGSDRLPESWSIQDARIQDV